MTQPVKIVLSANTANSFYNFRLGVIKAFLAKGYQVHCVCQYDKFAGKLIDMGCVLHYVNVDAKGTSPIADLKYLFKLYQIYKIIKPDLTFHYTIKPNIYGSLAAKLTKIPSVAVTTGLGYIFLVDNWVSKLSKLLYKFAFLLPKQVWFLNKDDKAVFVDNKLVDCKKAVLLDSEGINTTYFSPRIMKCDDKKTFKFLLIARMLWDKGILEYVDAAKIIKESHPHVIFQLLGSCDDSNPSAITRSQVLAWQEAGWVEYLGQVDDVRFIIAQSDCVVLPSYREGVPRTLLEAASMEKPLITTDSVGCKEVVIDNETGYLCRPKNTQDLAEKMIRMQELSVENRLMMGKKARDYVLSRFEEQKVIAMYLRAVEDLTVLKA